MLLLPDTVIYMPIIVPLGLPRAEVRAGAIAIPLGLTMLLPLALGLLVRAYSERFSMPLLPLLGQLSTLALVALIATTVLANLSAISGIFGTGAIAPALILIGGAFAIGHLLGGSDREARAVLGLGTAQRNIAAATVVATQAFRHPDTVSMVIVPSLAGFAVLFPLAAVMRRRKTGSLSPS